MNPILRRKTPTVDIGGLKLGREYPIRIQSMTDTPTADVAKTFAQTKELIAAGNARRLIIKTEKGEDLIEIPLTVGAIGALLLPVLAAIGAIAALVTKCSIVVIKNK